MSFGRYKLGPDNMTPEPCDSLEEWAIGFNDPKRILAKTDLGFFGRVSTVFLGMGHNFGLGSERRPLLWETMAWLPGDELQYRDTSWVRAAARHRMIVRLATRFICTKAQLLFPDSPEEEQLLALETVLRLRSERDD